MLKISYTPQYPIRIVTAASLFDGHDAAINMIRRLLQDAGCEVIHLGHNRSVAEIVQAALQEAAQAICISSYQGGHMEFFRYMRELLDQAGASYVKIFGGGGGVILPREKRELEAAGITRIYHPDDTRIMGLEGMIEDIIKNCDYNILDYYSPEVAKSSGGNPSSSHLLVNPPAQPHLQMDRSWGLLLTQAEEKAAVANQAVASASAPVVSLSAAPRPLVVGLTGTGGAGKSSLVDELLQRFLNAFPSIHIGVLCVDPTKRKSGGALLGDRIRMNSLSRKGVFMRSVATRGGGGRRGSEISASLPQMLEVMKSQQMPFDLLFIETSGIGQASSAITEFADISMYVMTSEYGAASQLEKIDMLDIADIVAINKADHRGSQDALHDVRKQYRRSRNLFDAAKFPDSTLPVFLTQSAQFNDLGVHQLFEALTLKLQDKQKEYNSNVNSKNKVNQFDFSLPSFYKTQLRGVERKNIIPPERQNYLAEVAACVRRYKELTEQAARLASRVGALKLLSSDGDPDLNSVEVLQTQIQKYELKIADLVGEATFSSLCSWQEIQDKYYQSEFKYEVRNKTFSQSLVSKSLSGTTIRKVILPRYSDWGDRLRYIRLENVPGDFPYTAGVFPLKRDGEDPTRMFAGEGPPERTNRRFHYLSQGQKAARLSTAFDSVTLYGQDPDLRPDIFGKVGESGVSICTIEDMKRLYAGFDLCHPSTSVSMTINGPAPMILAFFLNTAIDQQLQLKEKGLGRSLTPAERDEVEAWTLENVRGTVQADILKEDQGQNTCIFSIDFALKMMGDIQEYFIQKRVRNFYSVSISGYHIAEAGANPITQAAFTLANAFTYVEYYLARGLKIDDFAPNLSFFFSNGLDPEYAVIGRVARRIWAIALRDIYGANERSQKLKYHIQTSGRSLHAQEIDFNDIRTTLQALMAIQDNCNSLHTNAYDEAITTPSEDSVRRALAIQMIIQRELGGTRNENPLQGSYYIQELTDVVEEAVLQEFLRINERGGVLGAMETQYQRSKIQDESMLYEHLKHSGELPIIGVNTFLPTSASASASASGADATLVTPAPSSSAASSSSTENLKLARASEEEKKLQLNRVLEFQKRHQAQASLALRELQQAALEGENIFAALMKAAQICSLGQMSQALYEIGGQYRRNL